MNRIYDALRHLDSLGHNICHEASLADVDEPLAHDGSPSDALEEKLLLERIHRLAAELPGEMQEIVSLLCEGCHGQEVARRLGVDRHKVYETITWLKDKIRQ